MINIYISIFLFIINIIILMIILNNNTYNYDDGIFVDTDEYNRINKIVIKKKNKNIIILGKDHFSYHKYNVLLPSYYRLEIYNLSLFEYNKIIDIMDIPDKNIINNELVDEDKTYKIIIRNKPSYIMNILIKYGIVKVKKKSIVKNTKKAYSVWY